jgi:hypothetical protein
MNLGIFRLKSALNAIAMITTFGCDHDHGHDGGDDPANLHA